MIDILSFGGGVGSWGYAALVAQGKIRAPWMAAIVDTGREITSTWEYIERHRSAMMRPLDTMDGVARFCDFPIWHDDKLPLYQIEGER